MSIESIITAKNFPVLLEDCGDTPIIQPPPLGTNYGILKPRLLYINGFDTGKHQSLYREVPSAQFGGEEDFEWISSGGANGGGYLRSKINPNGHGQHIALPSFSKANFNISYPNQSFGNPEEMIDGADMFFHINMFGTVLTQPMNFAAFLGSFVFTRNPQIISQILPDYSVRVILADGTIISAPSTVKINPNSWQGINCQLGVSKFGNDKSGFCKIVLHEAIDDYEGTLLLDLQGLLTRGDSSSDTINGYKIGTEVKATGSGVAGIGFDDWHICGNYGTVRKMFGSAAIDKLLPNAIGDVSQSYVSYDGRHPSPATDGPGILGYFNKWGDDNRVFNLLGVVMGLDDYVNISKTFNYFNAPLNSVAPPVWIYGFTGPATGVWTEGGGWGYNSQGAGGSGSQGPHEYPIDTIKRNDFYTGLVGLGTKELYKLSNPRPEAAIIVGASIFTLTGNREIIVGVGDFSNVFWSITSPIASILNDINHAFDSIIKINGTEIVTRSDMTDFIGNAWVPNFGYMREPWSVIEKDAQGNKLTLRNIQAGVQLNMTLIDNQLTINPGDPDFIRYGRLSLVQIGAEYSYRTREPNIQVLSDSFPIPKIVLFDSSGRRITLRNASVSWNGPIVSSIIDWGDGTPTETFPVSPRLDPASSLIWPVSNHTYTKGGTYVAKLTVIDISNKTASDDFTTTLEFVPPTASFSVVASSPGSLTLNFADTSFGPDGDIVSWNWNFGDGHTSILQNPSHTFSAPGTYSVSLTITDLRSFTDSTTISVIAPIPTVTGCGLSAPARAGIMNVMADDFGGGNPRFPAWGNTATFDGVAYNQVPYRAVYNRFSSNGTDHVIDPTKTWHGNPSLKMIHRADRFAVDAMYINSEFSSDTGPITDPDDNDFTDGRPIYLWFRLVVAMDPGIISDVATGTYSAPWNGLAFMSPSSVPWYGQLSYRAGALFWDTESYETDGGPFVDVSHNLGAVSELEAGNWYELIMYSEGDHPNNLWRSSIWNGPACSLIGKSPTIDLDKPAFYTGFNDLKARDVSWLMNAYLPVVDRAHNIGLIEIHHGFNRAVNPFNVGLT